MIKKFIVALIILTTLGAAVVLTNQQPAQAADQNASENGEKDEKEKKETIYNVELRVVEPAKLKTFVASNASLKADREVAIFSKRAGQIEQIDADEGDRVPKGQILVELDGDEARLKVQQAKVNLDSAKAEFDRIEKSYQKELVSAEDFDRKRFEYERRKSEHELAVYDFELTRVNAPFNGVITERFVEVGQTIQPSDKLFTLVALDPLEAEVYLTESQVARLKSGQTVSLSSNERFENPFKGRVDHVSSVVDKDTGTVKVRIAIHDAPSTVRPGSYAHLRIVTDIVEASATVPKRALIYDSRQNAFLFKVREAAEEEGAYRVEKVAVQTGVEEDGVIQITSGVSAGDLIVATGKEALKEGSLVRSVGDQSEGLIARLDRLEDPAP